jgi:hypothetical protein
MIRCIITVILLIIDIIIVGNKEWSKPTNNEAETMCARLTSYFCSTVRVCIVLLPKYVVPFYTVLLVTVLLLMLLFWYSVM